MRLYALLALLLWITSAVAYIDRNAVRRVEVKNMRIAAKVQKESVEFVTNISAEKEADAASREKVLDEKLAKLTRDFCSERSSPGREQKQDAGQYC